MVTILSSCKVHGRHKGKFVCKVHGRGKGKSLFVKYMAEARATLSLQGTGKGNSLSTSYMAEARGHKPERRWVCGVSACRDVPWTAAE